jgi:hypothetical protein
MDEKETEGEKTDVHPIVFFFILHRNNALVSSRTISRYSGFPM